MSDVLNDARDIIEKHTLLEADMTLRHLVAEVEQLRRIRDIAADLVSATSYEGEPSEEQERLIYYRLLNHCARLRAAMGGR